MPTRPHLIEGPVAPTLVRMTLPMFVAMFAMMGFNIVDTYFVGQLGTEQLAAMGFTLAVVMAVNSVSMGLGVGTTAVISRVIGAGDTHAMRRYALDAVFLGVLVASTISATGLLTIRQLFGVLGAEGVVLDYVNQYMTIWYLGLPLVIVPQLGNSGIRATGDTKTPAKIMITAMLANLVLDPVFIFGLGPVPAFGLRGAAIATVIAQAVALVTSSVVLYRRGLLVYESHTLRDVLDSWARILKVGVPAGITQLITPVSTGVITAIVAGYGVAAVAGFGVASRLEMFAVMFVMAMGAALVPFVGQNWGAGRKDRVAAAVRVAVIFSAGWGAFVWLLSLAIGGTVAGLFDKNPQVIEVVTKYMAIVFPSYMLLGALVTVTNALNALHRSVQSMFLSVLRMFVLYVPLAYAGSALFGLIGVWWAALAANVIAGAVGLVWFRRVFRRMEALPTPAVGEFAEEPSLAMQGETDAAPA